jgi:hypothetical protein
LLAEVRLRTAGRRTVAFRASSYHCGWATARLPRCDTDSSTRDSFFSDDKKRWQINLRAGLLGKMKTVTS